MWCGCCWLRERLATRFTFYWNETISGEHDANGLDESWLSWSSRWWYTWRKHAFDWDEYQVLLFHIPLLTVSLSSSIKIHTLSSLSCSDRQSVLSVCITIGERWSLVPLIHPVHHNIPAKIHKSNHKTPGRLSGSDWTDIIWLCQMVSSSQCPLLLWSTSAPLPHLPNSWFNSRSFISAVSGSLDSEVCVVPLRGRQGGR